MGSLEISIDERKFLDDENIIPFHTTILDARHLRTCANHTSSFPDIDHDGSIPLHRHAFEEVFTNGSNFGLLFECTVC